MAFAVVSASLVAGLDVIVEFACAINPLKSQTPTQVEAKGFPPGVCSAEAGL